MFFSLGATCIKSRPLGNYIAQLLINAVTGEVGTGTKMSDYPINQELGSPNFSEADFFTGALPDGP